MGCRDASERSRRIRAGTASAIISLVLLLTQRTAASPSPVFSYLTNSRDTNDRNLLRLGCIDQGTAIPILVAVFFRNGEMFFDLTNQQPVVEDRVVERVVVDGHEILFRLKRQIEGSFSCGFRHSGALNMSPTKQFVALPTDHSLTPPSPVFTSKIGSRARIECPQKPGMLLEQYFIMWRNSTSNEPLAEIPSPFASQSVLNFHNPRHSVDASSFALLIENTTLLDSAAIYQCELGVVDIQASRSYSYGQSEDVELLVYEPSAITVPPESVVVAATATPSNATFRCDAVGSETPTIAWKHAGNLVIPATTTTNKYRVDARTFVTARGGRGVSSVLTVLALSVQDTGMVECSVYMPPSPETGFMRLFGDSVSVPLTVLGAYSNLNVFITTTGDAIFSVTYPVVPLHPVSLLLHYHKVGGASEGTNKTRRSAPDITYTNMSRLHHVAFDATVPFDNFMVEISLVHRGVVGPGKLDPLVYDKNSPSDLGPIIRVAVIPGVLVVLMIATVFISLCCSGCR